MASSPTFSVWGGVRTSLLEHPKTSQFAICDKVSGEIWTSLFKYPKAQQIKQLGEFQDCLFQSRGSSILDLYVYDSSISRVFADHLNKVGVGSPNEIDR